jgi:hypothetical protein
MVYLLRASCRPGALQHAPYSTGKQGQDVMVGLTTLFDKAGVPRASPDQAASARRLDAIIRLMVSCTLTDSTVLVYPQPRWLKIIALIDGRFGRAQKYNKHGRSRCLPSSSSSSASI